MFYVIVRENILNDYETDFFNVHIIPLISKKWNNVLQNIQKIFRIADKFVKKILDIMNCLTESGKSPALIAKAISRGWGLACIRRSASSSW